LNNRYPVDDGFEDGYLYTIGICTSALETRDPITLKVGALQTVKKKTTTQTIKQYSVGSFEEAEVMIGSELFVFS
jgi:hypothetical protein